MGLDDSRREWSWPGTPRSARGRVHRHPCQAGRRWARAGAGRSLRSCRARPAALPGAATRAAATVATSTRGRPRPAPIPASIHGLSDRLEGSGPREKGPQVPGRTGTLRGMRMGRRDGWGTAGDSSVRAAGRGVMAREPGRSSPAPLTTAHMLWSQKG